MENKRDQKRTVTELYNRVAPIYGGVGPNFFKHCGRRMVELAEISPGAKVLDVACGRGASLFPAAEAVGNHGSIIGIDLASRMLRETKKEIEKGQRHIFLNLMDGDELGFSSNAFDFVLCGFAIFFFPYPDLTLQEWNRVLVPGGKLMICVVGESDKRWNWFDELLIGYHELHGFPISPISEGRKLHRPDEIRSLMLDSRFREAIFLPKTMSWSTLTNSSGGTPNGLMDHGLRWRICRPKFSSNSAWMPGKGLPSSRNRMDFMSVGR